MTQVIRIRYIYIPQLLTLYSSGYSVKHNAYLFSLVLINLVLSHCFEISMMELVIIRMTSWVSDAKSAQFEHENKKNIYVKCNMIL